METVFDIIAEPNRRAILSLLASVGVFCRRIERQLGMTQPTVSKHLRVLREAGFVESRSRRTAAALSPQARAAEGSRCLAGPVPALLVEARRRPGATSRPDGQGLIGRKERRNDEQP